MRLNLEAIRIQFPALNKPVIFFDNPGGTQVTRQCLERMQHYLLESNANHGGAFATSQESDATINAARSAVADFLNASQPEEIVFGPNMTSLTFNLSRSLARTFNPGDVIVVTRLDHDANISPWLLAAQDRGCRIRWVDFHPEDCTLDLDDLQAALEEKPRLLALGYASNAVGTINPLEKIIPLAHAAGTLVYVDAVHYAPHGPVDVQDLDCDFLVCSAYKFFGPHLGVLYGRYNILQDLMAYRVRPSPSEPPGKFETGTGLFEGIAGLLGSLDYFEWLGSFYGNQISGNYHGRRLVYKQALAAIRSYEYEITRGFLQALPEIPGLHLYGITDPCKCEERVPTFSFTIEGKSPRQVAEYLGNNNIFVWDGNFYALAVTERLGLEGKGGFVRVGATHYNTLDEVEHLAIMLRKL